MNNFEGWVFAKELEKQYKNTIYWVKMWILVLFFIVAGVWVSLYTQWEQEKYIQIQKQGEIEKIQASFNPDTSQEKIDKLLAQKVEIKETPSVKENENMNMINGILSDGGKEIQSYKTEELRIQKEQQSALKETAFVWDVCFLASKDADKKMFFNIFNYTNAHLVKNFTNKLNTNSIDYKMYCFAKVKLTAKYITNTLKKYEWIKDFDEKKKFVYKNFAYFQKLSSAFYEVKFSKKVWMSDLTYYEGCWNDEIMEQVFPKLDIYPLKLRELQDGYKVGKISGSSHCVMPEIKNLFLMEKWVPITNYYENLFKDNKTFNEMKESSHFKRWYSGLTYQQGMEKFMHFLNTSDFQGSWSVFSKWEDIKSDYILTSNKAQIKKYFVVLSQIINF